MRSFMFASLVLCAVLLAVNAQDPWCLHGTQDTNSVYNVTQMSLTTFDANNRTYTMNSCGSTTCGTTSSCQICQWGVTCTAYSYSGVYTTLPENYTSKGITNGYQMDFYGAVTTCPGGKNRLSIVYALCGQPKNEFVFLGEFATCEYTYELRMTGQCTFVAPKPTIKSAGQTWSAVTLQIDIDPVLYNLWFIERWFNVTMDGVTIYHGASQYFDHDLPRNGGNPVRFQVYGRYGRYYSLPSDPLDVTPLNQAPTDEELIQQKLAVLQGAVSNLAEANNEVKEELRKVEQQITVDVLPVIQHGDNSATAARTDISSVNTAVGAIKTQITKEVVASLKNLDSTLTDVDGQVHNITAKGVSGGSSSSSSSGGGGWVALGLFLGGLVGIIGTIAVQKFVLPRFGGGGGSRYGYSTNTLVDGSA